MYVYFSRNDVSSKEECNWNFKHIRMKYIFVARQNMHLLFLTGYFNTKSDEMITLLEKIKIKYISQCKD